MDRNTTFTEFESRKDERKNKILLSSVWFIFAQLE
jgi:hypothetical protein